VSCEHIIVCATEHNCCSFEYTEAFENTLPDLGELHSNHLDYLQRTWGRAIQKLLEKLQTHKVECTKNFFMSNFSSHDRLADIKKYFPDTDEEEKSQVKSKEEIYGAIKVLLKKKYYATFQGKNDTSKLTTPSNAIGYSLTVPNIAVCNLQRKPFIRFYFELKQANDKTKVLITSEFLNEQTESLMGEGLSGRAIPDANQNPK